MTRIAGYTDAASVAPGGRIACHVSAVAGEGGPAIEYDARLVRITGLDPDTNEERAEPVASSLDGRRFAARVERTAVGSYGRAPTAIGATEELGLHVTFQQTGDTGSEQALIAISEVTGGELHELALVLSGRGPMLCVSASGTPVTLALEQPVEPGRWYRLQAGLTRETATASIELRDLAGRSIARRETVMRALPDFEQAEVFVAARGSLEQGRLRPSSFFTGRLEFPAVVAEDRPLARWDLGARPDEFLMIDVTGHGHDGVVHGVPQLAVTGSNWDGRTTSIHDAPDQYRAGHFWADAIEDAGWPAAFVVDVPADAPSGLYGIVLDTGEDRDTVPFAVRPAPESERDVALLLPTATYMAYSNARFTWEKPNYEVQRDRTVELGRTEQILVEHPEFGSSSYDQYLDGSNITFVSWLRPNLDMRAGQRRAENYPSDLLLIHWLHVQGLAYDVITDGELDGEGVALLSSYRQVIMCSHPEYASTAAMEALSGYVAGGGRLAVLGGNVLHFTVAFSKTRPYLMEVRKDMNRPAGTRAAAEGHLALTGEYAADASPHRPSERVIGASTASMGFDGDRPYQRLAASRDPRVAFVFEGVDDDTIGDGGPLNAAVGQEWDNTTDVTADMGGESFVLARSRDHTVNARWFGATKRRNHAEMVLMVGPGAGAVFLAGSMTWCRCLHLADVSRVTANVIRRFLDPRPLDPDGPGAR